MSANSMAPYQFEVTGGFSIDLEWSPQYDASGVIAGFRKPSGEEVMLAVCLIVTDSRREKVCVGDKAMERLGFTSLDYDKADFYPATTEEVNDE